MKPVYLLLNPARRQGRRRHADTEVRAAIKQQGHEVVELRPDSAESVADTVAEARDDGMARLVIAGGDGLIHRALPAIARTDVTVGIVGVGTGNDFARGLGLPAKLAPAVAAALAEPAPVDLIEADNDRLAASVVTGGFSGRVTERANGLRFPPGRQRYTVATLLELGRLRPVPLRLTVDGETYEEPTTLFAVANSRFFGGGMAICPEADPTDALLDVTVIGAISALVLARMLPTVFSGRHVNHPAVTTFRGSRVELSTEAGLWADGEPFAATALRAAPGALRIAGTLKAA